MSKRCCPTCSVLLECFATEGENPKTLLVNGFHSTVTACSLPEWLPDKDVDYMDERFMLLRKGLVDLLRRSELSLDRVSSIDSEGSIDGRVSGPGENAASW